MVLTRNQLQGKNLVGIGVPSAPFKPFHLVRLDPCIVHGKLGKVRQDRKRELCCLGVTALDKQVLTFL